MTVKGSKKVKVRKRKVGRVEPELLADVENQEGIRGLVAPQD